MIFISLASLTHWTPVKIVINAKINIFLSSVTLTAMWNVFALKKQISLYASLNIWYTNYLVHASINNLNCNSVLNPMFSFQILSDIPTKQLIMALNEERHFVIKDLVHCIFLKWISLSINITRMTRMCSSIHLSWKRSKCSSPNRWKSIFGLLQTLDEFEPAILHFFLKLSLINQ